MIKIASNTKIDIKIISFSMKVNCSKRVMKNEYIFVIPWFKCLLVFNQWISNCKRHKLPIIGCQMLSKNYHPRIIFTIAKNLYFLLLVMLNSLVHSGRYYSNTVQLSLTLLHSLMAITFVKFMTKNLKD